MTSRLLVQSQATSVPATKRLKFLSVWHDLHSRGERIFHRWEKRGFSRAPERRARRLLGVRAFCTALIRRIGQPDREVRVISAALNGVQQGTAFYPLNNWSKMARAHSGW